jgi:hypothetical protein
MAKKNLTLTPRHQLPRGHAWSAGRPQRMIGDKRRRRFKDKLRKELQVDR